MLMVSPSSCQASIESTEQSTEYKSQRVLCMYVDPMLRTVVVLVMDINPQAPCPA